jgi:streptogramin lyase
MLSSEIAGNDRPRTGSRYSGRRILGVVVPRIRSVNVLAVSSLVLALSWAQAATGAPAASAAQRLDHSHVLVNLARVAGPDHSSPRVIDASHPRVVQAQGTVRQALVVHRAGRREIPVAGGGPLARRRKLEAQDLPAAGSKIVEYALPTAGSSPEGVTVTANGVAWFTESNGNQIGKVTAAGQFAEYPIPPAQNDSGGPQGITVGADNNLWFTTYSYIGRMTRSGSFSLFPITPHNDAFDIVLGPDGNAWFTEIGGMVGNVTLSGIVTEYSLGAGIHPAYITSLGGALWFTATSLSANYVYQITTDGSLTQYVMPSKWILGDITAGPDGRLWFDSNTTALTAMTTSGSYTTYHWPLKSPNGYNPQYIRAEASGKLAFATFDDSSIGQMTTSGVVSFTPVPSGNSAVGVGVGPDGTIWFSEPTGNAIGKFPQT